MIDSNLADKVQRPRKERLETHPYNAEELDRLFHLVKGTNLELGVMLAAFYGPRRRGAGVDNGLGHMIGKTVTYTY